MMASGMNLVTTVIGFGMSATFIVFVCARLICGRLRSPDSSHAHAAAYDVDLRSDDEFVTREHIISGLQPLTVAAIPTMKYSKDGLKSREDTQCSICLGDYQEKEILRVMPECSHNFHLACIDVWLQKQATCPICRVPLSDSSENKRVRTPFQILRPLGSPRVHRDHTIQWQLSDNHRLRGNNGSTDVHESFVRIESPDDALEAGR